MVSRYDRPSKLPKKVILENAAQASLGASVKRHDVPSARDGELFCEQGQIWWSLSRSSLMTSLPLSPLSP